METLRILFPTDGQLELQTAYDEAGRDVAVAIDLLIAAKPRTPSLMRLLRQHQHRIRQLQQERMVEEFQRRMDGRERQREDEEEEMVEEEWLWEDPVPQRRRVLKQQQQPPAVQRNRGVEVVELPPTPPTPIVLDDVGEDGDWVLWDGDGGAEQLPVSEDGCIAGILQVLPDACPNFLKAMYKEHHTLHPKNLVPFLVDKLLEEGYTRAEKVDRSSKKRKRDVLVGEEEEISEYDAPDRQAEQWPYYELM